MSAITIQTQSLVLVSQTKEEARTQIDELSASERACVSAAWLALLESSSAVDPWVHGFVMTLRTDGKVVGKCGYTGPPGLDGVVEIAYGVDPSYQGRGYATEAAGGLVAYAFADSRIRLVCAHTFSEVNASTRVLMKCGFQKRGEVISPEDGLVWRWERRNRATPA